MNKTSRGKDYFESLYARNPDPWDFASSLYEHEKYAASIAALENRHFKNALEVGCSIGVLTSWLAPQCDRLLAVDVADAALAQAKTRCAGFQHVHFENRTMPMDWPTFGASFDLIVLSEILYFLSPTDIGRLAAHGSTSLSPGGAVLLVNYTEAIDEPCSGNEAAEIFIAKSKFIPIRHIAHPKYRIDLLKGS